MFGAETRFPYELDSPITPGEDLVQPIWTQETGEEIEKRMEEIEESPKNKRQGLRNLEEAQARQKVAYDLKRSRPAYNVGDKVLKRNARKDTRMGGKLEER